jgi:SAM-dependent methyltransferase
VDVIISNCVINLSADKARVLAEAFRVLRPGGRLGVSDVVADEDLDPRRRADAEERVGCSSGTLTTTEYRHLLIVAGFTDIRVTKTTDAGGGLHSALVRAAKAKSPADHLALGAVLAAPAKAPAEDLLFKMPAHVDD